MQTDSDHYIASRLDVELIDHKDGQITRQTMVVPRTTWTWGTERKEDWVRLKDFDLGEGGGGCVFLEQCVEGGSTKRRAVKVVKCLKIDHKKEIEAAMLFSHPKYHESFVESYGWYKMGDDICIAMEYLPLGSLGSVPKPVPENETSVIVRQILQALRHMDAHSFVHRDIKPENILVKQTGPNWWIKIADFGISKRAKLDNAVSDTGWYSRGYEAPEQRGMFSATCSHTTDIFTTGLVAYLLLAGRLPFPKDDPGSLVRYCEGRNSEPEGSLRSKVSPDGRQFIMMLLHPKPTHRPTAEKCLEHGWVKSSRLVQEVTAVPQEPGTIENKTQPMTWWGTWTSLNFTGLFTAEEPKKQAADGASQEAKDDKLFEISRTLSNASTASQALSNCSTAPNRVHPLPTVGEEPLHQPICASPCLSARIEDDPRDSLTPPEEKIFVSPVNGQKRSFTDPYSAGFQQCPTAPQQIQPIRSQRQSGTYYTSANDAAVHAQEIPVSPSIGIPQFYDSGYHSPSPPHMHSRRSTMDNYKCSQTPYRHSTPPVSPPSTRCSYEAPSGLRVPITHSPRASLDISTPYYHPHSARRVPSMASFSSECSATAWEGETVVGECSRRVTALTLAGNGKYGASWSQDTLLKLWDPRGGQNRGETEIKDVTSLLFSPGSTILAVRTIRALKLFKIEEWPFPLDQRITIGGNHPKGYVFANECVFSRDSQHIAAVLEGSGEVWLFSTKNGLPLRRIKTTGALVTSIAASPDLCTFAGSLNDNTVRIWGWQDRSEDRAFRHCASSSVGVTRVAYNADGWVAATSKCGVLQIRDRSNNVTVESKAQGCELLDCAFCPDKDLVVTADSHGYVRFFEASTAMANQNLWIKHREKGPVLRVLISPDGTWGVSCGYSTLEVWHTATAGVVLRSSMPQSDDGEWVKACFGSTPNKANILAIAFEAGVRLLDLGPLSGRVSTQHPWQHLPSAGELNTHQA